MDRLAVEIRYSGELDVRPYRRGAYVGSRLLDEVIEQARGSRYSFGSGWRGEAEVTIRLFEAPERGTSLEGGGEPSVKEVVIVGATRSREATSTSARRPASETRS